MDVRIQLYYLSLNNLGQINTTSHGFKKYKFSSIVDKFCPASNQSIIKIYQSINNSFIKTIKNLYKMKPDKEC